MKLLVLTLFSVTLAAASEADKAQDGVTDESGNRYGIYETNYRGAYRPIVEYAPESRHPVVEYAAERRPIEYERPKIIEEVVLGYGRDNYAREGYRSQYPGYYGYEGITRYPKYEYRRYGREGLGFERRTAYALGLRYPVTPQILETIYRTTYHDSHNVLQL